MIIVPLALRGLVRAESPLPSWNRTREHPRRAPSVLRARSTASYIRADARANGRTHLLRSVSPLANARGLLQQRAPRDHEALLQQPVDITFAEIPDVFTDPLPSRRAHSSMMHPLGGTRQRATEPAEKERGVVGAETLPIRSIIGDGFVQAVKSRPPYGDSANQEGYSDRDLGGLVSSIVQTSEPFGVVTEQNLETLGTSLGIMPAHDEDTRNTEKIAALNAVLDQIAAADNDFCRGLGYSRLVDMNGVAQWYKVEIIRKVKEEFEIFVPEKKFLRLVSLRNLFISNITLAGTKPFTIPAIDSVLSASKQRIRTTAPLQKLSSYWGADLVEAHNAFTEANTSRAAYQHHSPEPPDSGAPTNIENAAMKECHEAGSTHPRQPKDASSNLAGSLHLRLEHSDENIMSSRLDEGTDRITSNASSAPEAGYSPVGLGRSWPYISKKAATKTAHLLLRPPQDYSKRGIETAETPIRKLGASCFLGTSSSTASFTIASLDPVLAPLPESRPPLASDPGMHTLTIDFLELMGLSHADTYATFLACRDYRSMKTRFLAAVELLYQLANSKFNGARRYLRIMSSLCRGLFSRQQNATLVRQSVLDTILSYRVMLLSNIRKPFAKGPVYGDTNIIVNTACADEYLCITQVLLSQGASSSTAVELCAHSIRKYQHTFSCVANKSVSRLLFNPEEVLSSLIDEYLLHAQLTDYQIAILQEASLDVHHVLHPFSTVLPVFLWAGFRFYEQPVNPSMPPAIRANILLNHRLHVSACPYFSRIGAIYACFSRLEAVFQDHVHCITILPSILTAGSDSRLLSVKRYVLSNMVFASDIRETSSPGPVMMRPQPLAKENLLLIGLPKGNIVGEIRTQYAELYSFKSGDRLFTHDLHTHNFSLDTTVLQDATDAATRLFQGAPDDGNNIIQVLDRHLTNMFILLYEILAPFLKECVLESYSVEVSKLVGQRVAERKYQLKMDVLPRDIELSIKQHAQNDMKPEYMSLFKACEVMLYRRISNIFIESILPSWLRLALLLLRGTERITQNNIDLTTLQRGTDEHPCPDSGMRGGIVSISNEVARAHSNSPQGNPSALSVNSKTNQPKDDNPTRVSLQHGGPPIHPAMPQRKTLASLSNLPVEPVKRLTGRSLNRSAPLLQDIPAVRATVTFGKAATNRAAYRLSNHIEDMTFDLSDHSVDESLLNFKNVWCNRESPRSAISSVCSTPHRNSDKGDDILLPCSPGARPKTSRYYAGKFSFSAPSTEISATKTAPVGAPTCAYPIIANQDAAAVVGIRRTRTASFGARVTTTPALLEEKLSSASSSDILTMELEGSLISSTSSLESEGRDADVIPRHCSTTDFVRASTHEEVVSTASSSRVLQGPQVFITEFCPSDVQIGTSLDRQQQDDNTPAVLMRSRSVSLIDVLSNPDLLSENSHTRSTERSEHSLSDSRCSLARGSRLSYSFTNASKADEKESDIRKANQEPGDANLLDLLPDGHSAVLLTGIDTHSEALRSNLFGSERVRFSRKIAKIHNDLYKNLLTSTNEKPFLLSAESDIDLITAKTDFSVSNDLRKNQEVVDILSTLIFTLSLQYDEYEMVSDVSFVPDPSTFSEGLPTFFYDLIDFYATSPRFLDTIVLDNHDLMETPVVISSHTFEGQKRSEKVIHAKAEASKQLSDKDSLGLSQNARFSAIQRDESLLVNTMGRSMVFSESMDNLFIISANAENRAESETLSTQCVENPPAGPDAQKFSTLPIDSQIYARWDITRRCSTYANYVCNFFGLSQSNIDTASQTHVSPDSLISSVPLAQCNARGKKAASHQRLDSRRIIRMHNDPPYIMVRLLKVAQTAANNMQRYFTNITSFFKRHVAFIQQAVRYLFSVENIFPVQMVAAFPLLREELQKLDSQIALLKQPVKETQANQSSLPQETQPGVSSPCSSFGHSVASPLRSERARLMLEDLESNKNCADMQRDVMNNIRAPPSETSLMLESSILISLFLRSDVLSGIIVSHYVLGERPPTTITDLILSVDDRNSLVSRTLRILHAIYARIYQLELMPRKCYYASILVDMSGVIGTLVGQYSTLFYLFCNRLDDYIRLCSKISCRCIENIFASISGRFYGTCSDIGRAYLIFKRFSGCFSAWKGYLQRVINVAHCLEEVPFGSIAASLNGRIYALWIQRMQQLRLAKDRLPESSSVICSAFTLALSHLNRVEAWAVSTIALVITRCKSYITITPQNISDAMENVALLSSTHSLIAKDFVFPRPVKIIVADEYFDVAGMFKYLEGKTHLPFYCASASADLAILKRSGSRMDGPELVRVFQELEDIAAKLVTLLQCITQLRREIFSINTPPYSTLPDSEALQLLIDEYDPDGINALLFREKSTDGNVLVKAKYERFLTSVLVAGQTIEVTPETLELILTPSLPAGCSHASRAQAVVSVIALATSVIVQFFEFPRLYGSWLRAPIFSIDVNDVKSSIVSSIFTCRQSVSAFGDDVPLLGLTKSLLGFINDRRQEIRVLFILKAAMFNQTFSVPARGPTMLVYDKVGEVIALPPENRAQMRGNLDELVSAHLDDLFSIDKFDPLIVGTYVRDVLRWSEKAFGNESKTSYMVDLVSAKELTILKAFSTGIYQVRSAKLVASQTRVIDGLFSNPLNLVMSSARLALPAYFFNMDTFWKPPVRLAKRPGVSKQGLGVRQPLSQLTKSGTALSRIGVPGCELTGQMPKVSTAQPRSGELAGRSFCRIPNRTQTINIDNNRNFALVISKATQALGCDGKIAVVVEARTSQVCPFHLYGVLPHGSLALRSNDAVRTTIPLVSLLEFHIRLVLAKIAQEELTYDSVAQHMASLRAALQTSLLQWRGYVMLCRVMVLVSIALTDSCRPGSLVTVVRPGDEAIAEFFNAVHVAEAMLYVKNPATVGFQQTSQRRSLRMRFWQMMFDLLKTETIALRIDAPLCRNHGSSRAAQQASIVSVIAELAWYDLYASPSVVTTENQESCTLKGLLFARVPDRVVELASLVLRMLGMHSASLFVIRVCSVRTGCSFYCVPGIILHSDVHLSSANVALASALTPTVHDEYFRFRAPLVISKLHHLFTRLTPAAFSNLCTISMEWYVSFYSSMLSSEKTHEDIQTTLCYLIRGLPTSVAVALISKAFYDRVMGLADIPLSERLLAIKSCKLFLSAIADSLSHHSAHSVADYARDFTETIFRISVAGLCILIDEAVDFAAPELPLLHPSSCRDEHGTRVDVLAAAKESSFLSILSSDSSLSWLDNHTADLFSEGRNPEQESMQDNVHRFFESYHFAPLDMRLSCVPQRYFPAGKHNLFATMSAAFSRTFAQFLDRLFEGEDTSTALSVLTSASFCNTFFIAGTPDASLGNAYLSYVANIVWVSHHGTSLGSLQPNGDLTSLPALLPNESTDPQGITICRYSKTREAFMCSNVKIMLHNGAIESYGCIPSPITDTAGRCWSYFGAASFGTLLERLLVHRVCVVVTPLTDGYSNTLLQLFFTSRVPSVLGRPVQCVTLQDNLSQRELRGMLSSGLIVVGCGLFEQQCDEQSNLSSYAVLRDVIDLCLRGSFVGYFILWMPGLISLQTTPKSYAVSEAVTTALKQLAVSPQADYVVQLGSLFLSAADLCTSFQKDPFTGLEILQGLLSHTSQRVPKLSNDFLLVLMRHRVPGLRCSVFLRTLYSTLCHSCTTFEEQRFLADIFATVFGKDLLTPSESHRLADLTFLDADLSNKSLESDIHSQQNDFVRTCLLHLNICDNHLYSVLQTPHAPLCLTEHSVAQHHTISAESIQRRHQDGKLSILVPDVSVPSFIEHFYSACFNRDARVMYPVTTYAWEIVSEVVWMIAHTYVSTVGVCCCLCPLTEVGHRIIRTMLSTVLSDVFSCIKIHRNVVVLTRLRQLRTDITGRPVLEPSTVYIIDIIYTSLTASESCILLDLLVQPLPLGSALIVLSNEREPISRNAQLCYLLRRPIINGRLLVRLFFDSVICTKPADPIQKLTLAPDTTITPTDFNNLMATYTYSGTKARIQSIVTDVFLTLSPHVLNTCLLSFGLSSIDDLTMAVAGYIYFSRKYLILATDKASDAPQSLSMLPHIRTGINHAFFSCIAYASKNSTDAVVRMILVMFGIAYSSCKIRALTRPVDSLHARSNHKTVYSESDACNVTTQSESSMESIYNTYRASILLDGPSTAFSGALMSLVGLDTFNLSDALLQLHEQIPPVGSYLAAGKRGLFYVLLPSFCNAPATYEMFYRLEDTIVSFTAGNYAVFDEEFSFSKLVLMFAPLPYPREYVMAGVLPPANVSVSDRLSYVPRSLAYPLWEQDYFGRVIATAVAISVFSNVCTCLFSIVSQEFLQITLKQIVPLVTTDFSVLVQNSVLKNNIGVAHFGFSDLIYFPFINIHTCHLLNEKSIRKVVELIAAHADSIINEQGETTLVVSVPLLLNLVCCETITKMQQMSHLLAGDILSMDSAGCYRHASLSNVFFVVSLLDCGYPECLAHICTPINVDNKILDVGVLSPQKSSFLYLMERFLPPSVDDDVRGLLLRILVERKESSVKLGTLGQSIAYYSLVRDRQELSGYDALFLALCRQLGYTPDDDHCSALKRMFRNHLGQSCPKLTEINLCHAWSHCFMKELICGAFTKNIVVCSVIDLYNTIVIRQMYNRTLFQSILDQNERLRDRVTDIAATDIEPTRIQEAGHSEPIKEEGVASHRSIGFPGEGENAHVDAHSSSDAPHPLPPGRTDIQIQGEIPLLCKDGKAINRNYEGLLSLPLNLLVAAPLMSPLSIATGFVIPNKEVSYADFSAILRSISSAEATIPLSVKDLGISPSHACLIDAGAFCGLFASSYEFPPSLSAFSTRDRVLTCIRAAICTSLRISLSTAIPPSPVLIKDEQLRAFSGLSMEPQHTGTGCFYGATDAYTDMDSVELSPPLRGADFTDTISVGYLRAASHSFVHDLSVFNPYAPSTHAYNAVILLVPLSLLVSTELLDSTLNLLSPGSGEAGVFKNNELEAILQDFVLRTKFYFSSIFTINALAALNMMVYIFDDFSSSEVERQRFLAHLPQQCEVLSLHSYSNITKNIDNIGDLTCSAIAACNPALRYKYVARDTFHFATIPHIAFADHNESVRSRKEQCSERPSMRIIDSETMSGDRRPPAAPRSLQGKKMDFSGLTTEISIDGSIAKAAPAQPEPATPAQDSDAFPNAVRDYDMDDVTFRLTRICSIVYSVLSSGRFSSENSSYSVNPVVLDDDEDTPAQNNSAMSGFAQRSVMPGNGDNSSPDQASDEFSPPFPPVPRTSEALGLRSTKSLNTPGSQVQHSLSDEHSRITDTDANDAVSQNEVSPQQKSGKQAATKKPLKHKGKLSIRLPGGLINESLPLMEPGASTRILLDPRDADHVRPALYTSSEHNQNFGKITGAARRQSYISQQQSGNTYLSSQNESLLSDTFGNRHPDCKRPSTIVNPAERQDSGADQRQAPRWAEDVQDIRAQLAVLRGRQSKQLMTTSLNEYISLAKFCDHALFNVYSKRNQSCVSFIASCMFAEQWYDKHLTSLHDQILSATEDLHKTDHCTSQLEAMEADVSKSQVAVLNLQELIASLKDQYNRREKEYRLMAFQCKSTAMQTLTDLSKISDSVVRKYLKAASPSEGFLELMFGILHADRSNKTVATFLKGLLSETRTTKMTNESDNSNVTESVSDATPQLSTLSAPQRAALTSYVMSSVVAAPSGIDAFMRAIFEHDVALPRATLDMDSLRPLELVLYRVYEAIFNYQAVSITHASDTKLGSLFTEINEKEQAIGEMNQRLAQLTKGLAKYQHDNDKIIANGEYLRSKITSLKATEGRIESLKAIIAHQVPSSLIEEKSTRMMLRLKTPHAVVIAAFLLFGSSTFSLVCKLIRHFSRMNSNERICMFCAATINNEITNGRIFQKKPSVYYVCPCCSSCYCLCNCCRAYSADGSFSDCPSTEVAPTDIVRMLNSKASLVESFNDVLSDDMCDTSTLRFVHTWPTELALEALGIAVLSRALYTSIVYLSPLCSCRLAQFVHILTSDPSRTLSLANRPPSNVTDGKWALIEIGCHQQQDPDSYDRFCTALNEAFERQSTEVIVFRIRHLTFRICSLLLMVSQHLRNSSVNLASSYAHTFDIDGRIIKIRRPLSRYVFLATFDCALIDSAHFSSLMSISGIVLPQIGIVNSRIRPLFHYFTEPLSSEVASLSVTFSRHTMQHFVMESVQPDYHQHVIAVKQRLAVLTATAESQRKAYAIQCKKITMTSTSDSIKLLLPALEDYVSTSSQLSSTREEYIRTVQLFKEQCGSEEARSHRAVRSIISVLSFLSRVAVQYPAIISVFLALNSLTEQPASKQRTPNAQVDFLLHIAPCLCDALPVHVYPSVLVCCIAISSRVCGIISPSEADIVFYSLFNISDYALPARFYSKQSHSYRHTKQEQTNASLMWSSSLVKQPVTSSHINTYSSSTPTIAPLLDAKLSVDSSIHDFLTDSSILVPLKERSSILAAAEETSARSAANDGIGSIAGSSDERENPSSLNHISPVSIALDLQPETARESRAASSLHLGSGDSQPEVLLYDHPTDQEADATVDILQSLNDRFQTDLTPADIAPTRADNLKTQLLRLAVDCLKYKAVACLIPFLDVLHPRFLQLLQRVPALKKLSKLAPTILISAIPDLAVHCMISILPSTDVHFSCVQDPAPRGARKHAVLLTTNGHPDDIVTAQPSIIILGQHMLKDTKDLIHLYYACQGCLEAETSIQLMHYRHPMSSQFLADAVCIHYSTNTLGLYRVRDSSVYKIRSIVSVSDQLCIVLSASFAFIAAQVPALFAIAPRIFMLFSRTLECVAPLFVRHFDDMIGAIRAFQDQLCLNATDFSSLHATIDAGANLLFQAGLSHFPRVLSGVSYSQSSNAARSTFGYLILRLIAALLDNLQDFQVDEEGMPGPALKDPGAVSYLLMISDLRSFLSYLPAEPVSVPTPEVTSNILSCRPFTCTTAKTLLGQSFTKLIYDFLLRNASLPCMFLQSLHATAPLPFPTGIDSARLLRAASSGLPLSGAICMDGNVIVLRYNNDNLAHERKCDLTLLSPSFILTDMHVNVSTTFPQWLLTSQ